MRPRPARLPEAPGLVPPKGEARARSEGEDCGRGEEAMKRSLPQRELEAKTRLEFAELFLIEQSHRYAELPEGSPEQAAEGERFLRAAKNYHERFMAYECVAFSHMVRGDLRIIRGGKA